MIQHTSETLAEQKVDTPINQKKLTGEDLLREKIKQFLPQQDTETSTQSGYETTGSLEENISQIPLNNNDAQSENRLSEPTKIQEETIPEQQSEPIEKTISTENTNEETPLPQENQADKTDKNETTKSLGLLSKGFFSFKKDSTSDTSSDTNDNNQESILEDRNIFADISQKNEDTNSPMEICGLIKDETDWYYKEREGEKERLKAIQKERIQTEELFRAEEEETKNELKDLERRRDEEKIKLKKIQGNRIQNEEKYHQQEREMRKMVDTFEERKIRGIKQLELVEQKRKQGEQALKQLDDLMNAEINMVDKKIDQEKENLRQVKIQAINAKEKLKEFETLLQDKQDELSRQDKDNRRLISKLNDEIQKAQQESEDLGDQLNKEINDILERRNQLQGDVDNRYREFERFKSAKEGEKERLEAELNRLSRYCEEERTLLYRLKEDKVNLEQQITETTETFDKEKEILTQETETVKEQIEQLKQKFAQEWTSFDKKKKEISKQAQRLLDIIAEKKGELKKIQTLISSTKKNYTLEKDKATLELENIHQEIEVTQTKLHELQNSTDHQRKLFEEQETKNTVRNTELQKELETEEQKLFEIRNSFLEEQRKIDHQLNLLRKKHKEEKDDHKTEIHKLNMEKQRVKNSIDQITKKQVEADNELTNINNQKMNLMKEVEEARKNRNQQTHALKEDISRLQREVSRVKNLRTEEEAELGKISLKRQRAEEDYQARLRILEAEIDNLSQTRLEQRIKSEQSSPKSSFGAYKKLILNKK